MEFFQNASKMVVMLKKHKHFEEPIMEVLMTEFEKQDKIQIKDIEVNQVVACQWSEDEGYYRAVVKKVGYISQLYEILSEKSIFIKYRGSPDRGIVLILYFQGILLETDSVLKITFDDLDFRLNHNLARTTLWPGHFGQNETLDSDLLAKDRLAGETLWPVSLWLVTFWPVTLWP